PEVLDVEGQLLIGDRDVPVHVGRQFDVDGALVQLRLDAGRTAAQGALLSLEVAGQADGDGVVLRATEVVGAAPPPHEVGQHDLPLQQAQRRADDLLGLDEHGPGYPSQLRHMPDARWHYAGDSGGRLSRIRT